MALGTDELEEHGWSSRQKWNLKLAQKEGDGALRTHIIKRFKMFFLGRNTNMHRDGKDCNWKGVYTAEVDLEVIVK